MTSRKTPDTAEPRRFAATVSYDGTDFLGSQVQANGRTVQGELETAAEKLFGAHCRVSLAGRTDSGVHAWGQVASFIAATRLDEDTIRRALNAHLPGDVAVRNVREVPGEFDPRRWARKRHYRYIVNVGEARFPLLRRNAWYREGNLDLDAMQRAADHLPGRGDFAACSGPVEDGRTTIRTVFSATWRSESCALLFDIEADAFLPQMVRRLVGAMVRIGHASATVKEFGELLEAATIGTIGPTAPPHGLYLLQVTYDEGYPQ
jgi:tRNA pseudouridine38-40 synthase